MKVRGIRATMLSAAVWALCTGGALAQTEIEFIQWWEPEMPAGALRGIMDEFEAANPDIKVTLVSGPYSATHDQIVIGAGGEPFANVCAAGEIMAGNVLRSGYLAGFGMTIGHVFGRISGESASRHVGH